MADYRILFVCMGNICRSPAAEGVMKYRLAQEGLEGSVEVDSAGTISFHSGERADTRMRRAAQKRGVTLESRARPIAAEDLERFDLIVTMDQDNYRNVCALDEEGRYRDKIKPFVDYCTEHDDREVPDPYYGGEQGFEHVLDLLEDGCSGLLESIRAQA